MKSKYGPKVWKSDTINTKNHWAVDTVWEALSSNKKDKYQIKMVDKGFTCSCPAFRKCKHIKQVEERFE